MCFTDFHQMSYKKNSSQNAKISYERMNELNRQIKETDKDGSQGAALAPQMQ